MSQYNPHAIRRTVRRADSTPDGQVIHVTKSFTNSDDIYHPTVDTATGYVHCDCADFRYRRAQNSPTVLQPEAGCKHTRRAIAGCVRRGELVLPVSPAPRPRATSAEVDVHRNDF